VALANQSISGGAYSNSQAPPLSQNDVVLWLPLAEFLSHIRTPMGSSLSSKPLTLKRMVGSSALMGGLRDQKARPSGFEPRFLLARSDGRLWEICVHRHGISAADLQRFCYIATTATQQYTATPFITPQQSRHPTGSLLQLGTGAMFFVRSDGVGC
jgi:hypothetical protein